MYIDDSKVALAWFARCLCRWNMDFTSVWRDDLIALQPGAVDVLLLHGGWYGIDRVPAQDQYRFKTTPDLRRQGDAVRAFAQAGGGVVGVCAGAFNVVWLGLIEADISRSQGAGMHGLEVVNPRHPICRGIVRRCTRHAQRQWEQLPAIRINGPIFFPKDRRTMVLSYDWEQRLGAVLAGAFGHGRAVAISPHPERTQNETAPDSPMRSDDLMPAAGILRNALYWAAGRAVPPVR